MIWFESTLTPVGGRSEEIIRGHTRPQHLPCIRKTCWTILVFGPAEYRDGCSSQRPHSPVETHGLDSTPGYTFSLGRTMVSDETRSDRFGLIGREKLGLLNLPFREVHNHKPCHDGYG